MGRAAAAAEYGAWVKLPIGVTRGVAASRPLLGNRIDDGSLFYMAPAKNRQKTDLFFICFLVGVILQILTPRASKI